ncbi:MAG: hypothetical protein ACRCT1_23210 [Microcoleaceae cyanobacterium]|jgi:hypothetical protein
MDKGRKIRTGKNLLKTQKEKPEIEKIVIQISPSLPSSLFLPPSSFFLLPSSFFLLPYLFN